MDNMFRTLGKKVELIRYRVTYMEDEMEMTESCISDEHKNEVESNLTARGIEFTTVAVDQTGNEWINGLEFDSYDKALVAFNNPDNCETGTAEEQLADLMEKSTYFDSAIANLMMTTLM